MTLPIIILGGGGHAKVLIEALRLRSVEIVGILDSDASKLGTEVLGIRIIGDDSALSQYAPGSLLLANGIGSVNLPKARTAVFDRFKAKGFTFATVVHPSAVVASDAVLGEGSQIMAGAVIQPGCIIGRNSIVNTMSSVDHDCIIGDHVHLAPGVVLSGTVLIEQGVHIGTGATLLQGIRIGAGAVIGAGSLILEDVPENVTVMGAPGRMVEL